MGGLVHTNLAFVGVFGARTDPTLFLMVGNLTEVGGHFKALTDSALCVGFGLTPIPQIQQEYSHGFWKKMIREIRGIRGF